MSKISGMPAFFGRGLPTLSTSTPQQPLQLTTAPRGPSTGSCSGISSIPYTARTTSAHSLSSGVHSLTRDQTTSSLAATSSLAITHRREEESKFQTPGMKTLEEYRKKTKDNIENSKAKTMSFINITIKKYKTFSVLIYSYINTSGNWKNEKLCGNTTPAGRSVFTQFRVFPIFTSVDVTVYQYGKNVLYFLYNIAQRTKSVDIELYQHGS